MINYTFKDDCSSEINIENSNIIDLIAAVKGFIFLAVKSIKEITETEDDEIKLLELFESEIFDAIDDFESYEEIERMGEK